jgi:hypothetical protein
VGLQNGHPSFKVLADAAALLTLASGELPVRPA